MLQVCKRILVAKKRVKIWRESSSLHMNRAILFVTYSSSNKCFQPQSCDLMARRLLKIQQIKGALLDLFMKSLLSIKKKKKFLMKQQWGQLLLSMVCWFLHLVNQQWGTLRKSRGKQNKYNLEIQSVLTS